MSEKALRIIFGFNKSYEELLEAAEIKKLEERRRVAFLNFANKTSVSERYKRWFPEKIYKRTGLRTEKKYCEFRAKTTRLYNSPLYAMRRLLNQENQDNTIEPD